LKAFVLSSFITALACSSGWAGGEKVGNGGGGEVEFASIRSELAAWVKARYDDGTLDKKLGLSESGTKVTSADLFLGFGLAVNHVGSNVIFQDDPIRISGSSTAPAGRICGNSSNPARIVCNNALWNASSPQIKYAIVFHEYLGVAGIETNQGEYSLYPISKNIVQYVRRTDHYELRADSMNRADAANEIESSRKRMEELQALLESPSPEDLAQYPEYNVQEKDRGIIRLLNRESYQQQGYTFQPGYYSFARLTHQYGYGSDIELDRDEFSSGFAGLDYGFFADLGNIDLSSLTLSSPGVPFAANYQTPGGKCEGPAPSVRAEQARIMHTDDGFAHADRFTYISRIQPVVGHTYILRSINYRETDLLVAFKIVRQDTSDGSLILTWKLLKKYAAVDCERND
jgi:hypothetical protein